jgi:hypothetical protein
VKIAKEYSLLIIIGLFIFAYLLDLAVEPLVLKLVSPYRYFQPQTFQQYPFSTVSIFIKAIAILFSPLWLLSFFDIASSSFFKPSILLVLSALLQLYAIQEVASRTGVVSLEWALSFTLAGLFLIFPTILLFIRSIVVSLHRNLTSASMQEAIKKAQQESSQEK